MSVKQVRLFVVGEGDPLLQTLIEQGMAEHGVTCTASEFKAGDSAAALDAIAPDSLTILLKPPL